MSKIKQGKSYETVKTVVDKNGERHTILVYGEITYTNWSRTQAKHLNFGYAICSAEDEFDINVGIKIAKKRFRYPLSTLNHTYLNEDMVNAILLNEVEYISTHLEKYLPKK